MYVSKHQLPIVKHIEFTIMIPILLFLLLSAVLFCEKVAASNSIWQNKSSSAAAQRWNTNWPFISKTFVQKNYK